MEASNLTVDVAVTGLDVPLMIIVGEKGQTKVFEHGKEVANLKQVHFRASVGEVPTYTLDKFVK